MARTSVERNTRRRAWLAAAILSALPLFYDLFFGVTTMFFSSASYGVSFVFTAGDRCTGEELAADIRSAQPLGLLLTFPVVVVVGAFMIWAITLRRKDEPTRMGQVAG